MKRIFLTANCFRILRQNVLSFMSRFSRVRRRLLNNNFLTRHCGYLLGRFCHYIQKGKSLAEVKDEFLRVLSITGIVRQLSHLAIFETAKFGTLLDKSLGISHHCTSAGISRDFRCNKQVTGSESRM